MWHQRKWRIMVRVIAKQHQRTRAWRSAAKSYRVMAAISIMANGNRSVININVANIINAMASIMSMAKWRSVISVSNGYSGQCM